MSDNLPELILKKYLLISAMWSGWRTVEELEETSGLSRSQVFRTMKRLRLEFDIQINNQFAPGEAYRIYRITDLGILHPEKFDLFLISVKGI